MIRWGAATCLKCGNIIEGSVSGAAQYCSRCVGGTDVTNSK